MKVLLIDVNCKSGSTGKIVYDLYTQLRKDGHDAAICYGRGRLISEPDIYKFSSKFEVYWHALLTRITGLTSCFSFFSTRRLIKFIRKFQPDIVHLHDLHGYFVNIKPVIEYLKQNKIKTVWTFHCEFMYTGKCGHAYDCENWKRECGKCPNLRDYPSTICCDFTRKMFRDKKRMFEDFNDLIITTPSKWLADRVKESFLKIRDIIVIHNGIDTENIFYPRNFDHLKIKHHITDEKIALAVAPDLMSAQKGGRYVLEIAKKMRNDNVKFILVGVSNLGETYDRHVIALGRTENQQELAEYYSMADVFIICSKRENFPTTCIEALSCGTPIIGFDGGGTKETAPEGYGIFLPFGDVDGLVGVLHSLWNGRIDFKSKEECAQFGRANYDKAIMAKHYFKIYGDMMNKKSL